ncbi:MAG: hypothetical protein HY900_01865, partial [Deltaproteobacteria bacterium]|nr:hypothetical protein [Deltaproteobacteria bacterium]
MRLAQQDPVLLARNRRSRRGLRRLSLLLFLACAWGGWAEAGSRIQDDLFSVSFPTASQGWAVGRWGTVLHTADGGTTWEKQKTGVDDTLASVSFVDAQNGWAVGDRGTILHTANGGKTWEKQKSPVP